MTDEEFVDRLNATWPDELQAALLQPGWRVYRHLDLPPEMCPPDEADRKPLVVLTPAGAANLAALIAEEPN